MSESRVETNVNKTFLADQDFNWKSLYAIGGVAALLQLGKAQ
jgi:hypothetical protein